MLKSVAAALACGVCIVAIATPAQAQTREYRIPAGSLKSALDAYARQSGRQVIYKVDEVRGARSRGASGNISAEAALDSILVGTGFTARRDSSGALAIVQANNASSPSAGEGDAGRAAAEAESAEEIVVTGSRLRGAQGASPVVSFSRADIERTGASTLQEVADYIPQASTNATESIVATPFNTTTFRLRGLPLGSTLILLNGRRVTASGTAASYFDLNSIPLAAVERVEVLSDSASAVYGADAIAGVVNFVLRKQWRGYELVGTTGFTDEGDQDEKRLSGTAGWMRGRSYLTVVGDYYQRDALLAGDRARSADADLSRFGGIDFRSTAGNPGNVFAVTGLLPGVGASSAGVPNTPEGGTRPSDFVATANRLNRESTTRFVSLFPKTRRLGGLLSAGVQITDTISLTGELLASDSKSVNYNSPPSLSRVPVPATNPFNPFGVNVLADYLILGLPPRESIVKTEFWRGLIGAKWEIGPNWSFNTSFLLTEDKTRVSDRGGINVVVAREILARTDPARTINVFRPGVGASSSVLNELLVETEQRFSASLRQYDAGITGTIFAGSSRPVEVAVGAEFRDEDIGRFLLTSSLEGQRSVSAAYGELKIPVIPKSLDRRWLQAFEVSLAGRVDDYSDFGTTFNPRYGLFLIVNDFVKVRATYSTSFLAPTLRDLFTPQITSTNVRFVDPRRGNEVVFGTQFLGGNSELDAENADSYNFGIVLSTPPQTRVSAGLTVDYFDVTYKNRIGRGLTATVLQNEDLFPGRVVREPPTAADVAAGRPGRLISVNGRLGNLGGADTRGLDIQAWYRQPLFGGHISANLNATRVLEYMAQLLPGIPAQQRLGEASLDGFAPKWKASASLRWSSDQMEIGGAARYTDAYLDYDKQRTVRSSTLFDLNMSVNIGGRRSASDLPDASFSLTVRNIFDKAPPFSNSLFGYDAFTGGDIRGRWFSLSLRKRFR